jgi:predicted amidohydrolase
MSSKYSCAIAASFLEEDQGSYFNSAILVYRGKFIGHYRKIHLFKPMLEHKFLSIGGFPKEQVFSVEDIKIGLLICYDLRFPEVSRLLALKNAQILVYVAEFPNPRKNIWLDLLKARAIENQIYVVGVNRIGTDPKYSFFGHSCIIDPLGEMIKVGTDKEEIISTEIDLGMIDRSREVINTYEDRKPGYYT